MTNPIKEQVNRTIEDAETAAAAYSVCFVGVEVEGTRGSTMRASFPEQNEGPFPTEANNSDPRPLLMNTDRGQTLLREVLMAEHHATQIRSISSPMSTDPELVPEQGTTSPPSFEFEVTKQEAEPSTSPTPTEPNHPGYPYKEHTHMDTDLDEAMTRRPYLATATNKANGEPRLLGTTGVDQPVYDEGSLTVQPVLDDPDNSDDDDEVTAYNFGEDAYLDPAFLQAMGSLSDRGLAAEGLRLVQLDGEFRYLHQWDKRLAE